jgi:hypothetical protein
MVKFRVSLNLNNFNDYNYSRHKTEKIIKFYEALANQIKTIHNYDIKKTQRQFKDYCEPLIKIKKNIFIENTLMPIIKDLCLPPTINIDLEFTMSPHREQLALKRFYNEYKGSMKNKSYIELRSLYYSTKIINFVNRLRNLINDNILWVNYTNRVELKTRYKPNISVSDATVLSLT